MDRSNRLVLASIVGVALLCSRPAAGQTYHAAFDWQVSADDGATWTSSIDVPQSQQHVLVHARVEFDHLPGVYFGGASFDVVVRTLSGGFSDTASQFASESTRWIYSGPGFSAQRFDDVLKIDDLRDTSPPGAGTRWIAVNNHSPQLGGEFHDNPAILFQFSLDLDGTPGRRDVSCVFRPPQVTGEEIALYAPPYDESHHAITTLTGASVNVVPAPTAIALLTLAAVAFRRSR